MSVLVNKSFLAYAAYAYWSARHIVYLTERYYLDLLHTIWLLSLNGKLHLAPLAKTAPHVLDLGCGTGIWSIEFGSVPTMSLFSR